VPRTTGRRPFSSSTLRCTPWRRGSRGYSRPSARPAPSSPASKRRAGAQVRDFRCEDRSSGETENPRAARPGAGGLPGRSASIGRQRITGGAARAARPRGDHRRDLGQRRRLARRRHLSIETRGSGRQVRRVKGLDQGGETGRVRCAGRGPASGWCRPTTEPRTAYALSPSCPSSSILESRAAPPGQRGEPASCEPSSFARVTRTRSS
jgi:hypothetical protein